MEPCGLNLTMTELGLNRGVTIGCEINDYGYKYDHGSANFVNQIRTISTLETYLWGAMAVAFGDASSTFYDPMVHA